MGHQSYCTENDFYFFEFQDLIDLPPAAPEGTLLRLTPPPSNNTPTPTQTCWILSHVFVLEHLHLNEDVHA